MNFQIKHPENLGGMNDRIRRLRQQNFDTPTTLSIERALIETAFYKENYGTMPIAVLRARNFYEICKNKTIYIGPDELIVGERGPVPKAVPTFPELTCHSVEDLHTLDTRELQSYHISQEDIDTYEREVIPYWQGKTQRERIFNHVSKEGKNIDDQQILGHSGHIVHIVSIFSLVRTKQFACVYAAKLRKISCF